MKEETPKEWYSYLEDTWAIYPIFSFYEINYSNLPWAIDDRTFIYSTVKTVNIKIKLIESTNFFHIYEVYPGSVKTPIGYILRENTNRLEEKTKIRFTPHSVSICTSALTMKEVERIEKSIIFNRKELSIINYNNNGEIVTDLHKIMGVSII